MSYILNLSLPLWWLFLPLIIAGLLATNLYRAQNIFIKVKANYQSQLREAQNRLDEALASEKELRAAALNGVHELKEATAKLHKLESDSVEREVLIVQLRKDLATENEILSGRLADKNSIIEQLKSKIELSELAHNETKADLEGLEQQFTEALSVISRTKRATKQWDKIMKEKAVNVVNTVIEAVKQKQPETITHDILGVPRIVLAGQSEDFNARHIQDLGSEVVRGIAEQKKAIEKELTSVVDMSLLEAGDSVRFRHGDIEVVRDIIKEGDNEQLYLVSTRNSAWYYSVSGKWQIVADCDLDIVQIIKPAKCYKSNKPCQFNCDGLCKNS
jgi:hypothetical protein